MLFHFLFEYSYNFSRQISSSLLWVALLSFIYIQQRNEYNWTNYLFTYLSLSHEKFGTSKIKFKQ